MDRCQEAYQHKLTTPDEALSHIPPRACLSHSVVAMEPFTLLGRLHTLQGRAEHIDVLTGLELGRHPFVQDPQYRDTFTVDSAFFMHAERASYEKGVTSYIPINLHELTTRRYGYKRPTVMLAAASPMDEHGYFHCSLSAVHERELLEGAELVILEVNPNFPVVGGETEIHISQVDHLVETNTPVPQLPAAQLTEADQKIGGYIAELVRDGDTIQLGIGSIPDAAAHALLCKRDLGVHTEMITSALVDLAEAGVLTEARKTLHPGKLIGSFALGDQRLYDMLDGNPTVEIRRAAYVNDPFVVAQNDNMVSINTCVEVDLTGQVASETIGSRQYSGSGGQSDTAIGAIHAKNGRSIIALHATAKGGSVSAISPVLSPGAVVTLSRNNVDFIVTEYGIAPLRGRSVRERVENLIAVAHPDFRTGLRREAQRFMLW